LGKACTFIVLIADTYDVEAKKELEEAIEQYTKRLRRWKIEKVSTIEM